MKKYNILFLLTVLFPFTYLIIILLPCFVILSSATYLQSILPLSFEGEVRANFCHLYLHSVTFQWRSHVSATGKQSIDDLKKMWPQASTLQFGYTLLLSRDRWQSYNSNSHGNWTVSSNFHKNITFGHFPTHKLEINILLSPYIYVPLHSKIYGCRFTVAAFTLFNDHCSCIFFSTAITIWQLWQ